MKLNKAQQEAVMHVDGPCMVLAGPGSGKTFTLVNRIMYLEQECHIPPQDILVITFTKAAALEMQQRYLKETGQGGTAITFGTFHGVFYGILRHTYRMDASNILSEEEKIRLITQIVGKTYIEWNEGAEDEKELLQGILEGIGYVKNHCMTPEEYEPQTVTSQIFCEIYVTYETTRKSMKKIDFDDMLVLCLDLFRKKPDTLQQWQKKFRYILVDEFQDINPVQYEVIKLLALPENNLFVVGDDDQSIYEFRGARPEMMFDFQKEYGQAKQVILDVNFRSTKAIIEAAGRVVEKNQKRFPKKIKSIHGQGENVLVQEVKDPVEESLFIIRQIQKRKEAGVPYQDMAVLFRTNVRARSLAETCVEYHIPFRMKEYIPNLYEHFIARDIAAYFRLAVGTGKRSDFLMILNRPKRYIGRDSVESPNGGFEEMKRFYCDKDWIVKRIEQFEHDVRSMAKMAPYAAIQYIRKKVGYDGFLKEYAEEKGLDYEELMTTLHEVELQSSRFATIPQWFTHVDEYTAQLKAQRDKSADTADAVVFQTVHGAKGLEYDTVFIIGVNENEMPYKKAALPHQLEEERRLFYVAMTRAKKMLFVSFVKEINGKAQSPSRFISELLFSL